MSMISRRNRLGILVAGGPSPGINSVIGAATIRSLVSGVEVVGILDGFKWIMRGEIGHVRELTVDLVSRIHFTGGSFIGIARDNPTKDSKLLEQAVGSLLRLNIDKLITIGGDDTAFSAMKVQQLARGRIHVVHVPKTIDNDLDLPSGISTFGFQTARHYGFEIVRNLMVDARTTSRWFFVVMMGRKAGHLALNVSKAAGNTLTLIPEEFPESSPLTMKRLVNIITGSIIKRLAYGNADGVAILAEGLLDKMPLEDLNALGHLEHDAHDNVRFDEIDFGIVMKREVQKRLTELRIKSTLVAKNVGYELRCCDPIAYDIEYTRDLGYHAATHLLEGGNAVMASVQNGKFVPIPFAEMIDPLTGRARIRLVDTKSDPYNVLQNFMIRVTKEDFDDLSELAKYASVAGMSVDEFREQFQEAVY